MVYLREAIAEDIVDVDPLRVARVRHTVVTHKHDIDNIGEIACL